MFNIHAGNLDSLGRITTQMRNFFTNRLLNGETTPEAIDRGVDMIIIEMQPFFQHFVIHIFIFCIIIIILRFVFRHV